MAKTLKRLVGPVAIATGPATIYTTPAGTKTKAMHLHVQNPSGSAVLFTLSIGADAAGKRLYDAFSIPAAGAGVTANVIDVWIMEILDAAEIIQAAAGTNNILVITINGEESVA